MKRVIFTAPEAWTEDSLSPFQLTTMQTMAVSAPIRITPAQVVLGQRAMPMPGTVTTGGLKVIDALATDDFDPTRFAALGLPFTVLGLWQWPGDGPLQVLQPLNSAAFEAHLPVGAPLAEPHRWAGWPAAF